MGWSWCLICKQSTCDSCAQAPYWNYTGRLYEGWRRRLSSTVLDLQVVLTTERQYRKRNWGWGWGHMQCHVWRRDPMTLHTGVLKTDPRCECNRASHLHTTLQEGRTSKNCQVNKTSDLHSCIHFVSPSSHVLVIRHYALASFLFFFSCMNYTA